MSEGAPAAAQVADRFHLVKNVRDLLEQVIKRQKRLLLTRSEGLPPPHAFPRVGGSYAAARPRLLPHLRGQGAAGGRLPVTKMKLPAASEAAWWLLRPEKLKAEERRAVDLLCQLSPEVASAQGLALRFVRVVGGRKSDELRQWLIDARRSEVPELVGFADGLMDDVSTARAALTPAWSQGQVEGQVNRLKMIKRQMYGRAKLDLLRARVLQPTL